MIIDIIYYKQLYSSFITEYFKITYPDKGRKKKSWIKS